ncbi:ABC transporter ATP-binding protein [bacterium]|nr:ABC transporter ATP-binding protein [bacterium]
MAENSADNRILEVKHLVTTFATETGPLRAVDGVSFSVNRGKSLGIVGESGCGKSVTSLSILRLLPKPAGCIAGGEVWFDGVDLVRLTPDEMRYIRGKRISMIFQEPMTALNPVHRIDKQLGEVYALHFPKMSLAEIRSASIELLNKVGISDPDQRLRDYPHQLSGGMRQRVMIAMALACRPQILIADEPTTALDMTIQAQILTLMKSLQQETGMAIIFITHDLGVIAETCDDVVVMYAGTVAERAPVNDLFKSPKHPYTLGLLASIPRLETPPKQRLATIEGMVPDLQNIPEGCRFQNRCHYAQDRCREASPPEETVAGDHRVSCYRWQEISLQKKGDF